MMFSVREMSLTGYFTHLSSNLRQIEVKLVGGGVWILYMLFSS